MPKICFVPGCKSGYPSQTKENNRKGISNPSLFSAPRDDHLFEKWRQIIPIDHRNFSSKDKVCELHFEKKCIERDYYNLKPDGSRYYIPKGHATLKKGSIPTIFPNLPRYLFAHPKKRKAPAPRACSFKDKHGKFNDNVENVIDIPPQLNDNLENNIDTPPQLNETLENIIDIPLQINDNFKNVIDIPLLNDNVENAMINTSSQFNDFLKFSVEVKNMLTPNSWWSVACTENFVIFAKWNSKCYPERRIVICKDLSTKIFLMNVEMALPIDGCTIENISQLLKKVDDCEICQNADLRTSSCCLGFLDSKRKVFCSPCKKSIKNEKDVQRRRKKHTSVTKKRKIFSQAKSIKKRNTYLQKRILDLKRKLVESKYQCSKTKEEVLLEAIAQLPIQQQTAIKSALNGYCLYLHN